MAIITRLFGSIRSFQRMFHPVIARFFLKEVRAVAGCTPVARSFIEGRARRRRVAGVLSGPWARLISGGVRSCGQAGNVRRCRSVSCHPKRRKAAPIHRAAAGDSFAKHNERSPRIASIRSMPEVAALGCSGTSIRRRFPAFLPAARRYLRPSIRAQRRGRRPAKMARSAHRRSGRAGL